MQDCIFCKIARGEIGSAKIYEDKTLFIFLDIMPANKGHALIIPKTHYFTFSEVPDEIACAMAMAAKRVAKMIGVMMLRNSNLLCPFRCCRVPTAIATKATDITPEIIITEATLFFSLSPSSTTE